MSYQRRLKRFRKRSEDEEKKQKEGRNNPYKKYLILLSIVLGAIVGYFMWILFFKCQVSCCPNSYNPIPYMGLFGIIFWVIGLYLFMK